MLFQRDPSAPLDPPYISSSTVIPLELVLSFSLLSYRKEHAPPAANDARISKFNVPVPVRLWNIIPSPSALTLKTIFLPEADSI